MTRIKMCGMTRISDIEAVNELQPEYIGFVFAPASKRFVSVENAMQLKKKLSKNIQSVGVFVNEPLETIASLLNENVIDIAQVHGSEGEKYIRELKKLSNKPVIKAFQVDESFDFTRIDTCCADYVLLDSGAGSGEVFDWKLLEQINRPFFLAGGLRPDNVAAAVKQLHPFAVDVSSGIERDGCKDREKMAAFIAAVR